MQLGDYKNSKIIGQQFYSALAKELPAIHTMSVSPGGISGGSFAERGMWPINLLMEHAPWIFEAIDVTHSLEDGAKRYVEVLPQPPPPPTGSLSHTHCHCARARAARYPHGRVCVLPRMPVTCPLQVLTGEPKWEAGSMAFSGPNPSCAALSCWSPCTGQLGPGCLWGAKGPMADNRAYEWCAPCVTTCAASLTVSPALACR